MSRPVVLIIAAILIAGILHGSAQQVACSPDPSRRQAAIRIAREINTKMAVAWGAERRFPAVDTIAQNTEGLTVSGVVSGDRYMFAVKEIAGAPCSFALFSDQNGMIYDATPLR